MNALTQPRAATSLAPRSFDEAVRFAEIVAPTQLVPAAYRNKPADILVAVQMGAEVGLSPMQALQNIAVINGKPAVYGDALLALAKASPVCVDVIETMEGDGDNLTAVCVAKRRNAEPVVVRFGVADAKRAGLWGKQGPWQQYPKRMLQMRARGFALRDAFPDALRGLITAEEAEDTPPPREVTSTLVNPASSNDGMRIAKQDMVDAGQAFRVLFPNGKDKLYATKPEAWRAIALAAQRCGDLACLSRLEEDNETLLSRRPGSEVDEEHAAALDAIETMRATLPPADPLPMEVAAEPEPVEPPAPIAGAGTIVELLDEAETPPKLRDAVLAAMRAIADAPDAGAVYAVTDKPGWAKLIAAADDYPRVKAALVEAVKRKTEGV